MNRRQLMMFSGAAAAAAAGQGLSGAQQTPGLNHSGASQRSAQKTLLKLNGLRSSYRIPKTDAKKTKLLQSLGTALALTPAQQQQAETIFTDAVAARANLRSSLKTARQRLRDAVKRNDSVGIDQMAVMVGDLKARLVSSGAHANASFYGLLAADQQAKITQFQS